MYGKPSEKLREAVTERASPGEKTQTGTVSEVYTAPKTKTQVKPDYTAEALSEGIEGEVIILVKIDAQGKVSSAKVIKG
jgi:outer membrane biosynthesis protein TonB